jgi:hypothetical protein
MAFATLLLPSLRSFINSVVFAANVTCKPELPVGFVYQLHCRILWLALNFLHVLSSCRFPSAAAHPQHGRWAWPSSLSLQFSSHAVQSVFAPLCHALILSLAPLVLSSTHHTVPCNPLTKTGEPCLHRSRKSGSWPISLCCPPFKMNHSLSHNNQIPAPPTNPSLKKNTSIGPSLGLLASSQQGSRLNN